MSICMCLTGTASPNNVPEPQEGENATTGLNTEAHFDAATAHINEGGPNEANPQWQPPENSNLPWIRIEDEGPFLTNANMIVLENEDHPPVENNIDATEEHHQWDIDSIMVVENRMAQSDMANGSAYPITSYSSQSDGFWEADLNQLPKAP
uniref:Uncharacterized protein n=1 Tax=Fagus sylvatica TaxID=28930 RepID=A0A2N9FAK1_FAGSY